MKIVFLQEDSFVKVAVEQLSALLKSKGHTCDLFIESGEKKFIESAAKSAADLFAFSCTTGGETWVEETSEKLKSICRTPIIVGGPHPTFFPQMIKSPYIDFICRGEGEEAIIELLETMDQPEKLKTIRNIWSKDPSDRIVKTEIRPFFEDLDQLPFPDFEIYTKYDYMTPYNLDMFPVMTGRGCPFTCSYCFNQAYRDLYRKKGRYLRKRSPEVMIAELVHAKKKWGITKINFVDDSIFIFPEWFEAFYPLYKEKVNLPFIINLEATHIKENLVKMAKDMGCICIRMGLETGDESLRKTVLNKKLSNERIAKAAALIKKYGIKLSTYNMLGLPGETLDQAIKTYTFNKQIGTDFAQCSLLQPYPGTQVNEYVKSLGLYEHMPKGTELSNSFFSTTKIKLENEKEVVNLQKLMQLFIIFKLPEILVRKIIKMPQNPILQYLFKLNFVLSKIKTQKIKIIPLVRLGLHSLSYMK